MSSLHPALRGLSSSPAASRSPAAPHRPCRWRGRPALLFDNRGRLDTVTEPRAVAQGTSPLYPELRGLSSSPAASRSPAVPSWHRPCRWRGRPALLFDDPLQSALTSPSVGRVATHQAGPSPSSRGSYRYENGERSLPALIHKGLRSLIVSKDGPRWTRHRHRARPRGPVENPPLPPQIGTSEATSELTRRLGSREARILKRRLRFKMHGPNAC